MNKILSFVIAAFLVQAYDSFSLRNYFTLGYYDLLYEETDTLSNYDNVLPIIKSSKTFYDFKSFDNDIANKTFCYYHEDVSNFMCSAFDEITKCKIDANFGTNIIKDFTIFGLEYIDMFGNVSKAKFSLYPRNIENETWLNTGIKIDNTTVNLSIFYSNDYYDFGLQVKEFDCWEKLVNFAKYSRNTFVNISSSNVSFFGGLFLTRDSTSYSIYSSYIDMSNMFSYLNNIFGF